MEKKRLLEFLGQKTWTSESGAGGDVHKLKFAFSVVTLMLNY